MIESVIKRDGRQVPFVSALIIQAVGAAMKAVSDKQHLELTNKIAGEILNMDVPNNVLAVDEISNIVEEKLIHYDLPHVAKAYIIYRHKRDMARNAKFNDTISDIIAAKKNDITRENANMNAETPAGMMMKVASEATKDYVDNFLLSDDVKEAVQKNIIHIHDKDYYPSRSLTCLHHPIDRILKNGFRAGHGESRPAKRIETASIIGCISMETIQNEMHGGQAIPAFDFYLAPYVRLTYLEELEKIGLLMCDDKEAYSQFRDETVTDYETKPLEGLTGDARAKQHAINTTVSRVHQSMEAFIHNMNTIHSRGGNQVVFSSINYGTDTSAEGRCVIRELLRSTYRGVGNNATAIFPIQIWKKKRGVNYLPEDKNYDLFRYACKVTARRFFPNFINLDAPFNQHEKWDAKDPERYKYEVATMGCRTRVFENLNGEKTSIGRGNLSFSTINLPGLALACMSIKDESARVAAFFDSLDKALALTKKQLMERFKFQSEAVCKQFPLLMSGMWTGSENYGPEDKVGPLLKQGTLGIGFIGLAECLVALTGKHHGESDEAQELGLRIIRRMGEKVEDYKKETNLNFSVLGTPAEGLSGRFTRIDRKIYGEVPGVTDKEYYTNSNHIPVWYKCSAVHKAKVEGPYHAMTGGGHIFYVEIDGDATKNEQAILDIVALIDANNIGYGSINHNRNRCMECSYETSDDIAACPKCGSTHIDRLQRITGYLVGTTDKWNSSKLAELNDRVVHGQR